jgi:hypothetical protein
MLRPTAAVTFYPAVRIGDFVQFRCGLHEKALGAGFRSDVISVARDFLLSSIYGDGNPNAGCVIAPSERTIFQGEKASVVEFLNQDLELSFAQGICVRATVPNVLLASIFHFSIAMDRDRIDRATKLTVCATHLDGKGLGMLSMYQALARNMEPQRREE